MACGRGSDLPATVASSPPFTVEDDPGGPEAVVKDVEEADDGFPMILPSYAAGLLEHSTLLNP